VKKRFVCLFALVISSSISLIAAPVTEKDVASAVKGWLNLDSSPFDSPLNRDVVNVNRYVDDNKETLFFVVSLESGGYVITSADDMISPIIAFSQSGTFNASAGNPLWSLLTQDLQGRNTYIKNVAVKAAAPGVLSMTDRAELDEIQGVQSDWQLLISSADDQSAVGALGISSISDLRVAPLLQTTWGQTTAGGVNTYNYYTPNNYPDGCVATALSQVMRYHEYPIAGIGVLQKNIAVDGFPQVAYTRGGDGSGGAYSWSSMPLNPGGATTLAERQMIGSLCYDAGVSVEMSYAFDGSGTDTLFAADALKNVFGYSNAVKQYRPAEDGGISTADFIKSINPNLDASLPVILGIRDSTGGHAIVCDGYGYNMDSMYHHLNMGWEGSDDVWYALPRIDTTYYDFTIVYRIVYNIYKSGTGEILSGRVVDAGGLPISGVTVSIPGYFDVTDANGVYAFAGLATGSYPVTAYMSGYQSASESHTVSNSVNMGSCGNVWGADFTLIEGDEPKSLLYVNIAGAAEVHENSSSDYVCTAQYSDGSVDLESLYADWSENSGYASINDYGRLNTATVTENRSVTISATFAAGGVTKTGTLSVVIKDVVAGSLYSGGSGTASDPYLIANKADLLYLAAHNCNYNKSFIMTADIDLAGELFTTALISPDMIIDNGVFEANGFSGSFDGDGYVIQNLNILGGSGTGYLGLFGDLTGYVCGLGLDDVYIKGSGYHGSVSGGLCGNLGGGDVERCYVTGVVSGTHRVGGMCGVNWSGTLTDCYAHVKVICGSVAGGFCGHNSYGQIERCYSTGTVPYSSASAETGGFCGRFSLGFGDAAITNCFWDYESCGLDQADSDGGTGKTTAEMQTQSTFENWDFMTTWRMDGYPVLRVFDGPVESLTIIGPSEVDEISDTKYSCEATFRSGYTADLSEDATWSQDSIYAEISSNGTLSVSDVPTNLNLTITAVYTNRGVVASDTHIVRIIDYPTLISLEIFGPESLFERKSTAFSCVASYSDGRISNVTEHATWVEDNGYTTIDSTGLLVATALETNQSVIVSASYTFGARVSTTMTATAGIVIINLPPGSYYSGGFGTVEAPFKIADKEDLLNFSANPDHYDRHLILIGNIDLAGELFDQAIIAPDTSSESGFQGVIFSGVFNGNGFSIGNLVIEVIFDSGYLGLFGNVSGTISNLGLESVDIYGSSTSGSIIGGVCGYLGSGLIEKCYATGDINGTFGAACVGGLCGKIDGGTIQNCFADVDVKGYSVVGGFCGFLRDGELVNCYSIGNVDGIMPENISGFCGSAYNSSYNGCLWDVQTSGQALSAAGVGKTTSEMMLQSTFTDAGWDFANLWYMDGYPSFSCFIRQGTYADWLLANPEIPVELHSETNSPAGDGIPNLLKYACGLPAMDVCTTADLMTIMSASSNLFSVLYYKAKSADDVTLQPIWAETLFGPWSAIVPELIDADADAERELWKASVPFGDSGFIKLSAEIAN